MNILFIILFPSCQNIEKSIVGKWEIEGIGAFNSKDIDILPITILNMVSVGGTFEFTDQGEFKTQTTEGKYSISTDGRSIILKDSDSEQTFEIKKVSGNKIHLKQREGDTPIVITLVKEDLD